MVTTNTSSPKKQKIGFSDEKLEMLCELQGKLEDGVLPWATWESENSSFGKTFRKWAFYPRFLPMYISSDHGVHWGSRCWPNEIENFKVFFTWNSKKNKSMSEVYKKKSYHVPHPWVFYRKKYFPTLPKYREGTLVFYAHSNVKTTPVYDDVDRYFADLKALPTKYQPIVICLSFHDIRKGLHKKLRKYNVPLVTAGTTNSQMFIDRFYTMLYQFKYSSSANIGSHTFYVIEAGIPFFLFGPYPKYEIKGSLAVDDGKQNLKDYGDDDDLAKFEKLKEIFSVPEDQVTQKQYEAVSCYLGTESTMTRVEASLILWRELFLHFGEFARLSFGIVKKLSSKLAKSL